MTSLRSHEEVPQPIDESLANLGISYLRQVTFPEKPEVDLVAVHGLNPLNAPNHGEKTWTDGKKREEKLWLRDFLPKQLPNVRVFLFGYNSKVAFGTSTAGVTEAAEDLLDRVNSKRKNNQDRPLVFVCHGLGGIVVKRAIAKAKIDSKYVSINRSTRGFAFFAIPHHGGHYAKRGDLVVHVVRAIHGHVPNNLMPTLYRDSLLSQGWNEDFMDQGENYRFWIFFETQNMLKHSSLIVNKSSAILGSPNEKRISMQANHATNCKFATEDDNYEEVISNITELVEWAVTPSGVPWISVQESDEVLRKFSAFSNLSTLSLQSIECRPRDAVSITGRTHDKLPLVDVDNDNNSISTTLSQERTLKVEDVFRGKLFLVPSRNNDFIGGEDALHRLKAYFQRNDESQARVALYGLGGMGKSQIALQFAYWYTINFPEQSVYWINASSAERLQQALVDIALKRHIPGAENRREDLLQLLQQWLQKRRTAVG